MPARLTAAGIALVAWLSVILRAWIVIGFSMGRGWSLPDGFVFVFSYFTLQTNLLVAVVASACALSGRENSVLSGPRLLGAVTVYILIVGVIYAVLLEGLRQMSGLALIVDIGLHKVVPVAFALYWLAFVPKGRLAWRDATVWLAYPLAYVVYSLIYGALTGRYLYPFSNVPVLGYPRALANGAVILLAFWAVGLLIVTIDRFLAARQRMAT